MFEIVDIITSRKFPELLNFWKIHNSNRLIYQSEVLNSSAAANYACERLRV